jgi:hypothetical protein
MTTTLDFPRMIYHVVDDPITVNDAETIQLYLDKGWSLRPVEFSEADAIRAKIKYHEAEAARLKEVLVEIDGVQPEAPVEPERFICECGYEAHSNAGLSAHKRHKHKEVEVT